MQVTVTCTSTDAIFALEISPEIELENFKVLVQVESGVENMTNMAFFHNGRILMGDKKTLKDFGVADNDVLLFGPLPQGSISANNPTQQPISRPPQSTASSSNSRSKFYYKYFNIVNHNYYFQVYGNF